MHGYHTLFELQILAEKLPLLRQLTTLHVILVQASECIECESISVFMLRGVSMPPLYETQTKITCTHTHTHTHTHTYHSLLVLVGHSEAVHGPEDGHHGLDGVAVHHRLVLGALLGSVAILMNDPAETATAVTLNQGCCPSGNISIISSYHDTRWSQQSKYNAFPNSCEGINYLVCQTGTKGQ